MFYAFIRVLLTVGRHQTTESRGGGVGKELRGEGGRKSEEGRKRGKTDGGENEVLKDLQ
jgi:hypothetical protein